MKVFCDTEWSDEGGEHLLSVGLVAENGQWCYVELRKHPLSTSFVREVIWPLLQGAPYRCEPDEAHDRILKFLSEVEATEVFSDFFHDTALLQRLLGGAPVGVALVRRRHPLLLQAYEDVFVQHPWAKEERHNALVDAFALRSAYRSVFEKQPLDVAFAYPFGGLTTPEESVK